MSETEQKNTGIYIAITAVMLAIFAIDLLTPLGYQEWVVYSIPVAMCIFLPHRNAAYVVALAESALMLIGYILSTPGLAAEIVIFNRAVGVAVLFCVAFLSQRVVVQQQLMRHLLWLQEGKSEISKSAIGEQELSDVGSNLLNAVARYVDAHVGRLYRLEGKLLQPVAAYALDRPIESCPAIALDQGLIGTVVRQGKATIINDIPDGYLDISSATGHVAPRHLIIAPITVDGRFYGFIELGLVRKSLDGAAAIAFLEGVAESIGVALRSALYRQNLRQLLGETQRQGEQLQTQHEELRVSNEELEEQAKALRESQMRLENQQAELEQTNVQLEEQAQQLEAQKRDLLRSQQSLERHAEEMARANQYKSEFLANMSHELRTPLNSSLILSQILAQNKSGTLTDEQVRYAKTIHSSNTALLTLINDILDLSKIEAGHMDIHPERVEVTSLTDAMRQLFQPIAQEKGIAFHVAAGADVPTSFITDNQRLQQILKNLLSNAFKFTQKGEVELHVVTAPNDRIAFLVRDTGIGIAEQQQRIIFEAFHQADGTTSRMFGGTGLGLSISRELARLLAGEIRVQSAAGLGSTFTLEIAANLDAVDPHSIPRSQPILTAQPNTGSVVPARLPVNAMPASPSPVPVTLAVDGIDASQSIADDRHNRTRDRLILIIDDDPAFAMILYDLAHERNFDCIHAASAREAIRLAREYRPHGILLDVGLPDQSGLSVLEQMKQDPAMRHIPVHMVSGNDNVQTALEMGAIGYSMKPVVREDVFAAIEKLQHKVEDRKKRVLIVEDNDAQRDSLVAMLKADDIDITLAGTVADALQHVAATGFDCVVTDLMLPDASGYDLLEQMSQGDKYAFPPVIVYTGRSLTRDEEQRLRRYSQSIIIKGAKSPERLLDEVTLFLHRVEASLPQAQQRLLQQARQRDNAFEGRRILVVEDDVRNIFALTSVLEPLGVQIDIARNGKEALDRLGKTRDVDVDLVLMDLMMPEMDGLTATREIRKQPEWSKLPIIALTAKAMADDRQNCLNAGANDYIAKPIDIDKLISLCRIWMPK